MNNAYKPPNAPVADPRPPAVKLPRRPWSITLASVFIVGAIFEACARLGRGEPFEQGFRLAWIIALAFIALMIDHRRNWARWVLMVVAAWNLLKLALLLAAPNLPEGVHLEWDYAAAVRECAAALCLVAATVLVFLPGREWFAR